MHTVYTERHKLHATDTVTLAGAPFVIEEVPARAEIILQAVQKANLGPVVTPTDHGLDPILAVHDAGFVEFLRIAYECGAPGSMEKPSRFSPGRSPRAMSDGGPSTWSA